ncbi:MAG: hypothetical protein Ta2B_04830 [Termitinemataceae bacterium]|nr:MAG: hypothetical protein Ta2B_04830 [Termitinemataceae bacterium]
MTYVSIDIVFLLLGVIIIVRAALHGFVEEVMNLAWLIFGFIFAMSFYKKGALILREKFFADIKILPEVLSFTALFLVVFIVVKIITYILTDIIERVRLGSVDHFLGMLFGVIESIAVIAFVIFILSIQPLFDKMSVLKNSIFYNLIRQLLGIG